MARPRNTTERRAQIVDAFITLLPRRGYAGASIAAIAAEAGLRSGLVHYHFDDKRSILLEAARVLSERLAARVASRADDDPRAALHGWIDAHLALGEDADPAAAAAWAAIGAEAQRDPEVRTVYTAALASASAGLETCLVPLVPPPRRALVAQAGVALLEGLFRVAAGAPGFVPPGSAAATARAALDALVDGA